jgi:DNA replication protein DnaC
MVHPLRYSFLSDEAAARLYKAHPEIKASPDQFCPTCYKKGHYKWNNVDQKCDCGEQLQLHKVYLDAGIGAMYQRLSWDDFYGDEALLELRNLYLENFETLIATGMGIILWGKFGVGKTMAMNLLLKDLLAKGVSVFSTTFTNMITMLTDGWDSREDKEYFREKMVTPQVLFIDDLGKEFKTKNNLGESTFDHILRGRVQNGRPTFITTNLDISEIEKGYGSAIMSLLMETSVVEEITGTDFRPQANQRKLKEALSGNIRPIV